jgi:trimeric autotransporter adhesin
MLVGTPHDANITVPTYLNDYAKYYGGYIQDDFRLSSKITLNLGLRWEHESGLQEQHNGLVTSFAPNVPSPIQSTVAGLTTNGVVEFAGQDHSKTSIGNPNWSKWGPRAGIAWQLNDKTVIRGGYGLYWARLRLASALRSRQQATTLRRSTYLPTTVMRHQTER